MRYNITYADVNRRVPKVVWSKGERYTTDNGLEVFRDLSFIFTEDTPPRNLTEALAFVHRHADVLPTDTIKVWEQTEWNYRNDNFRPAYVSALLFDGEDNLLRDDTDAANAIDESEVVLWGDDIINTLSADDLDYFYELLDQDTDIYVVGDAE